MLALGRKLRLGLASFGASSLVLAFFLTGAVSAQESNSLRSLFQSPNAPIPNLQYFSTSGEAVEELPVRQRPRSEYNALGIRGGSFLYYPSLKVAPFYDSNVYATRNNEQSDTGIVFSPNLSGRSDWNNHELGFQVGLDHYQHFDLTSESRTDAQAVLTGRLDVRSDLAVYAAVSAARRHERRGTSNSPLLAAEPVPYDEFDGSVSVNKAFNRVEVSLGVAAEHRNYHDVRLVGGGRLDQDFRDGNLVQVGGRIAYVMKPGIRVFGDMRYNWRRYENLPGLNGDSEGYNLLGGVEFTLTSLIRGELGIGYMNQFYEGAGISNASGLSYSANLIWNPTPLTTVTFKGNRSIEESGTALAAGRIDSGLEIILDYELRRNLILSPSIGFIHEDFAGITRTDYVIEPGIKIDYLINRNFSIGARYVYTHRDSDVNINDFDRHIVGVNAQAQF